MLGRFFYFISSLLFLISAFIFLSPVLLTPDLIYPVRIDSTYITFHAKIKKNNTDSLLLNPMYVGLKFSEIKITTSDDLQLNGWFVPAEDSLSNTIMIFHDLNESKILYIDHIKQFHDRGFNVCAFDLRAHGNSGGNEFTPGLPALDDAVQMIDSVMAKKNTKHLVLMGIGVGAAIALQAAVYDPRCKALILQNPFNSFENYIDRFAKSKWGIMKNIWFPVLKRRTTELLQYPLKELDLTVITTYTDLPSLFIIGSNDEKLITSETLQVYDAAVTEKKELFLVRNVNNQNIAKAGGELYYNRITAFLNSTLPKVQNKTRYKKLALNDF